jgi:hypothetical protein
MPSTATLPGRSRTIVVEPLERPAVVPTPEREPVPEPPREPVRADPEPAGR